MRTKESEEDEEEVQLEDWRMMRRRGAEVPNYCVFKV